MKVSVFVLSVIVVLSLVVPASLEAQCRKDGVCPLPLDSEAPELGIAGYRYSREGGAVTAEALDENNTIVGALTIEWHDGRVEIMYESPEGLQYDYVLDRALASATMTDRQTGGTLTVRLAESPEGTEAPPRWETLGSGIDEETARPIGRFIGVVYTDTLINLRIAPTDLDQDIPTVRPRFRIQQSASGGFGTPLTKMVMLDTCPPECLGPTFFTVENSVSFFGCCNQARNVLNAACTNQYCFRCCGFGTCMQTLPCSSIFPICQCSRRGRSCSNAGTPGQQPDGTILFCEEGLWPPECT